jgi:hypothetical protein
MYTVLYDMPGMKCLRQENHYLEQELLVLQDHLSSPPVFSAVRVPLSLACSLCNVLYIVFVPLSHFVLAIVLSVFVFPPQIKTTELLN